MNSKSRAKSLTSLTARLPKGYRRTIAQNLDGVSEHQVKRAFGAGRIATSTLTKVLAEALRLAKIEDKKRAAIQRELSKFMTSNPAKPSKKF